MTRPLNFRRRDRVNKKVGMTIDQTRQQRGTAQIDHGGSRARTRLDLRRRSNLFDLVTVDQNACRRENVAGTGIEQTAGFYDTDRRPRVSRDANKKRENSNALDHDIIPPEAWRRARTQLLLRADSSPPSLRAAVSGLCE